MLEQRRKQLIKKIDKPLLIAYLLLVFFGLLTIYSSSFSEEYPAIYSWNTAYGKQLFWILISLFAGVIIFWLDPGIIQNTSYLIYGLIIILLAIVLFMPAIKGAHSWFRFGGVTIQPSEFAKFATSLAVAKYLSTSGVFMKEKRTKIIATLLLFAPGILILLQPDPGTLLVFFSFIFVFYRQGLSGNLLLGGFIALIVAVMAVFFKASSTEMLLFSNIIEGNYVFMLVIVLLSGVIAFLIRQLVLPRYRKPKYVATIVGGVLALSLVFVVNWSYENVFKDRHRNRFEVMFGVKLDRQGVGYNIYQALSAIGSGEGTGKGYFKGTLSNSKFKHVPEQSTDFIFCSWAEEWGFLGSFVLIILFLWFLIRIIIIAERQRNKFAEIFGYCVASIIFFHVVINIAMVIGLAPVIGIPLPFFSKGGSAILGFSIMVFILLRLDAERKDILH